MSTTITSPLGERKGPVAQQREGEGEPQLGRSVLTDRSSVGSPSPYPLPEGRGDCRVGRGVIANPVIKDAIIEENRAHGASFLIVSHEMSVMRRLCRKITVMIEGRILAEGPSNTPLPISSSRRKPGPIWPQLAVGFMDPGLRREGGAK